MTAPEGSGASPRPGRYLQGALLWIVGFLAPIAFLCLLCAMSGVYPFGPESFLNEDAKFQYVDFFTWFKRVLSGDGNLMYSGAQSLGSNTWGLYSYYLASPLNLLIAFFDDDHIVAFVFVLCALKLGFVQIAFMSYLRERFEGLGWLILPLGFGATFCVWVVTDIRNPMWLDVMVWLPLAMLGAWRLVTQRRWGLLLVSFVGAVVTCWYTAYMLVLFTIFYALLESFVEHVANPGYSWGDFFGMLGRGAAVVAMSLAISAFTFVPTVMSLLDDRSSDVAPVPEKPQISARMEQPSQAPSERNPQSAAEGVGRQTGALTGAFDDSLPSSESLSSPLWLIEKAYADDGAEASSPAGSDASKLQERASKLVLGLFTGNCRFYEGQTPPQLFGGTFLIAGALFMLFSRRVSWRIKAVFLVFACFLILSVSLNPLYVFWCGFKDPSGFYCRIAMFFPVMLLWATSLGLASSKEGPFQPAAAAASCVLSCAPSWVLWAIGMVTSVICPVFAVLAALSAFFAISSFEGAFRARWALSVSVLAASVVVFVELLVNAGAAWSSIYSGYPQSFHDSYVSQSSAFQEALEERDDGAFRQAKTFSRDNTVPLNEGMAQGYMEIPSYVSAHNGDAVRFLNALGYGRPSEISVQYRVPMILADSLFGVKYVASCNPAFGYEKLDISDVVDGFDGFDTMEGVDLYVNPYALPLAYAVDAGMEGLAFDSPANPFERQNELVSAMLGEDVQLYRRCDAALVSEPGGAGPQLWSVDVPAGCIGYYYVMDDDISLLTSDAKCYVSVNGGNALDDAWRFGNSVTALSTYEGSPLARLADGSIVDTKGADPSQEWSSNGEVRHYDVAFSGSVWMDSAPPESLWCEFYCLDMAAFESAMSRLTAGGVDVVSFKDGGIELSLDESEGARLVMVTVPYDEGWSASVDGASVETVPLADGALMGIWAPPGSAHVSLSYISPGLVPGCVVTAMALASLIAYAVVRGRRARNRS